MKKLQILLFAVGCLAVSAGLSFADCADYSDNLHWLSSSTIPGHVNAAVFDNDRLYVATGCNWQESCSGEVSIYDILDPLHPSLLGSVSTTGSARDIVVVNDRIYVADGQFGLTIIDASSPSTPTVVSEWGSSDGQQVEVIGTEAYLLTSTSLTTIDVSNPAIPTTLGSISNGGTGMAISGDYVYILPGLTIVDVSVPATPQLVVEGLLYDGSSPADGDPLYEGQVEIEGNLLFTSYFHAVEDFEYDQRAHSRIYDISNPTAPVMQSQASSLGASTGVRLAVGPDQIFTNWGGDYWTSWSGLSSLDYSSGNLQNTGSWNLDATEMHMYGGALWVFSDGEAHRFEPGSLDSATLLGFESEGASADILVSGDYVFGVNDQSGWGSDFMSFDVSDPSDPVYLGGLSGVPYDSDMRLREVGAGYFAILSSQDFKGTISQITYVDASIPSSPTIEFINTFPNKILHDLTVLDGYGYAPSLQSGASPDRVQVIDFTTPGQQPQALSPVTLTHAAAAVAAEGVRLIVVGQNQATLLGIGTPSAPVALSTFDLSPFAPRDVVLTSDAAYVLADLGVESRLFTFEYPSGSELVWVDDQRVLGEGALQVDGTILAIGGKDYLNIAAPLSPRFLAGFRDTRTMDCYAISEGRLFTSVSRFSPEHPGIALRIYDLPCADVASIPVAEHGDWVNVRAVPNPARSNQRLTFQLPTGAQIDTSTPVVEIFDASGRRVTSVIATTHDGSLLSADWDGTNDQGNAVPAGVYATRLKLAGRTLRSRVVRVR